jgi:uncharacterized repeat protein (TIGR01451 family)
MLWLYVLLCWLVLSGIAHGYIIINAPMTDTNASGWMLGGNPNAAQLTGNGATDPVGSGWLRLTNSTTNQTGYAYNSTSFDLSAGLLVQFDYATWGGTGADGYSVFLFDANVPTFNIGAFGGSLGYAQKLPPAVPSAVPGISGGYVGVGVDEYGNFANPSEGRYQGPGQSPNTVTVRGSVLGFGDGAVGQTSGSTSYPWIATSANSGSLWYNGTTRPDQTSTNYRKVIMTISPAPNPVLNVWVQFGYSASPTQMITNRSLPAISASQLLQVGFGASTGGSTNYHEIRNLLITTINESTSIDLGITDTAVTTGTSTAITSAVVGSSFQYLVTAQNYGPNNITATGTGIVDNFPSYITPGAWTCTASGGATCGAASGSGNLNTTANLPQNGKVTYRVNATLNALPAGNQVTDSASLVIPGAVTDYYPNNNSATSTITVPYQPLTVTKSFSPAVLPKGQTSRMSITLTNPNSTAATGVALTDTYPSGLVNTGSASRSNSCGGTLTSGNNATSLTLSGATVPANGSCTVSVNTTSNTAGSYTNSTGSVTTTNIGNSNGDSDTLVAMAPPTVTKSYAPGQITVNGSSLMTITLSNPNSADITGAAFTDTYLTGIVNTAAAGGATTCGGGTVTAANGGTSLALAGGTIPANGSCTVTANVTSATAGSYTDATGTVTTSNAGSGTSSSATLTVLRPPTAAATFTPATTLPGGNSQLVVTLTNPNATAITGAAFSDTYPSGLLNAAPASASTTCSGGTVTAADNGASLSLSSGTIPANGSCTVTVNVASASAGAYTDSTGAIATDYAGSGTAATAALTVMAPPGAAMLFNPGDIGIGAVSQLTVTLSNPNATAITGAAFTDSYPAGMTNSASAVASTTCSGGRVTAANGGNSLALSSATIPANGSCTVTVNVTVNAAGTYSDSTGPISTTNAGTGAAATASLNGPQPPTASLAFTPASIVVNGTSQLTVTLTNANAVAITGVNFTDSYPTGLTNSSSASGSSTCGGTVTAANLGGSVALAGGTIPANGSCTVTVNVTSAKAGSYRDSSGAITTANAGSAAAASGTLAVMAPPAVTMSFSPGSVLVNSSSLLTVTLNNTNATDIAGTAFSIAHPAGLLNGQPASAATTCGGGTVTAADNGNSLTLAGATIPANGSCTVTVNVTPVSAGSLVDSTGSVTTANAGTAAAASATLTATLLAAPTVTETFAPAQTPVGTNSVLTITLANATATAVTGVSFTDSYPSGLVNSASASGATTCGGSLTAANNGASVALTGGTIPANGSCTVTVNVTSAAAASYTNSTGPVTSSNAVTATAASATLAVLAPPAVTLAFSPSPAVVNTISVLTVTLTNSNTTAITGAAFSDSYPAGLVNAPSASAATTCGGTATGANNGTSVALSGGTIPAGGSCTVTVNVTSATAGSYSDSTGTITTSNAGSGTAATASLTMTLLAAPSVTKAFSPNQVVVNGSTTLTITLTNTASLDVTAVAFSDTFPTSPGQMVVSSGSTIANSCGGVATIGTGGRAISLTGGTIPANGSCSVAIGVSAPSTGSYTNTTSTVTSTNATTAAAASASLTVAPMAPPTAVLTFSPNQVGVGGGTVLTVKLTNPNSVAISGASFADSYPSGLLNAAAASASTTCSGGTVTASNNGSSLALSGAGIAANGSCTVTVNVVGASVGSIIDSTGAIATSNAGTGTGASATLYVLQAPTATLQFSPAMMLLNDTAVLTVTLSNPNSLTVTGVSFSDSYPSGLVNTSSAAGATSCISGSATAANSGNSLALSGATIPGNGSCTVTVNVTSSASNTYVDSTGPISTSNAGTGSAASGSVIISGTPVLSVKKTATAGSLKPGEVATYTVVVTNSSTGYAKDVLLTDYLSPYVFWGVDSFGAGVSFSFTDGTPPSGLSLGTPSYSRDGGTTWGYPPVSGAGGAPASFDGYVTDWRIRMVGTMAPNGANFTLTYKVRIR